MSFAQDFIFGAATASYQIEGAHNEDGRTPSIWDTFSRTPGRVKNGDTGDVADDHYHRYKDDVAIMKELGIDSYRFSIAWPRIFPKPGVYNEKGMQFYKNLLAELKKQGIKAAVTLYHWDAPQWFQDMGGWENRENVPHFVEYAQKCFTELDADVSLWITHNEPWCASILSNLLGTHAPGKTDPLAALQVAHHLLLSHGETVRLYHKLGMKKPIGITLNMNPVYPVSDSFADKIAAELHYACYVKWFMDPLFKKTYPAEAALFYASRAHIDFSFVKAGDFDVIAEPCDFLGVNFYQHSVAALDTNEISLTRAPETNLKKTAMGWDITPEALYDLIKKIRSDYTDLPIYITENGSAWDDSLENGRIADTGRTDYLLKHLDVVRRLNQEHCNIKGYYCWSLLDNFEWAEGYDKRFGIVYVDYKTQKRYPKDSYFAYKDFIQKAKSSN